MGQHLGGTRVEVDISKRNRGRHPIVTITKDDLIPLWPNGKGIAEAKLLIPKSAHHFYINLFCDKNVEDYLDGFGRQPDFVIR
ncbi:hypothetical protein PR048_031598 [Dryococelus australis]|uniref:Uncharacterized protein n=1 Tax=Dryococelus australis TaxID=614101 RepID=A0ABQ9G8P5_9NEOP|nr:hypothetical protein PR048_031598 [Dryococelus australis]